MIWLVNHRQFFSFAKSFMENESEIEQILKNSSKVVGTKQVLKSIASDELRCVVISEDADEVLKSNIISKAQNAKVEIKWVSSKDWLGKVSKIAVCAAVVGIKKL